MEKINKSTKTELIKEVLFVMLFSGALAAVLCFLIPPRWESNDDWSMASMVAGSYGTYTSYMVFVHPFIGILLKQLYILFPAVPWLGVLWEGIVYCSFAAALWIFRADLGRTTGTVIWTVFMVLFGWAFYSIVNFTRVAAIVVAVGYLLIFSGLRKKQYLSIGFGAVMVWLGYMVRLQSWFMITALAGGVGLAELLAGEGTISVSKIIERIRNRKQYLVVFAVVFAGCICLTAGENFYNSRDPQIGQYKEFTALRAALWDYPALEYEEIQDELTAIGVSRTNYNALMKGFIISDPVFFSTDSLAAIKALQEPASPNLAQGASDMVKQMSEDQAFLMLLACCMFVIAAPGKKRLFLAGWLVVVFAGMNLYLGTIGRNPERVLQSLCAAGALYLLWSLDKFRMRAGQVAALLAFAVVLNNEVYFHLDKYTLPEQTREEQILTQAVDELRETGRYYLYSLTKTKRQLYELGMEGMENLGLGARQHLILTGGWGVNMPVYCWQLAQAGTENPYRDILTNDNLLLIDDYMDGQLFQYIRENYDDYNNRKNWSVCGKIMDGVYIIGFNDNKTPTVSGTDIEWMTAQKVHGSEEDLIWLKVYFDGDASLKNPENVYYLQVTDASGETRTFRGEVQETQKGLMLLVGLYQEDISGDELEVAVLRKNLEGQYEETESVTVDLTLVS